MMGENDERKGVWECKDPGAPETCRDCGLPRHPTRNRPELPVCQCDGRTTEGDRAETVRSLARAGYDQHRRYCRRSPAYCRTCRRLRAEAGLG